MRYLSLENRVFLGAPADSRCVFRGCLSGKRNEFPFLHPEQSGGSASVDGQSLPSPDAPTLRFPDAAAPPAATALMASPTGPRFGTAISQLLTGALPSHRKPGDPETDVVAEPERLVQMEVVSRFPSLLVTCPVTSQVRVPRAGARPRPLGPLPQSSG